jgi:hypothetical protein
VRRDNVQVATSYVRQGRQRVTIRNVISNALASFCGQGDPAIRTLTSHAVQILTKRANRTVDVIADDEAVGTPGGLTKRSVVVGLPGVALDVKEGRRGRLQFAGGSPAGAELHGFEQDGDADRPLARRGDKALLGTLTYTPLPTTPPSARLDLSIAQSPYSNSPGGARSIGITFVGAVTGMAPGVPVNLISWITSGSPEVNIRHFDDEDTP